MNAMLTVSLGLVVSFITGVAGVYLSDGFLGTLQVIFLENIFIILVDIWLSECGHDPYFGHTLRDIRRNRLILDSIRAIMESSNDIATGGLLALQEHSIKFLKDTNKVTSALSKGRIHIDLRPGGVLFREVHAVDRVADCYCATTCADPLTYWDGSVGRSLLERNRLSAEKWGKIGSFEF